MNQACAISELVIISRLHELIVNGRGESFIVTCARDLIRRIADNAVEKHGANTSKPESFISDAIDERGGISLKRRDKVFKVLSVDGTCAVAQQRSARDSESHRRLAEDENIFSDDHIPETAAVVKVVFRFFDVAEAGAINFIGDIERIQARFRVDVEDMLIGSEKIFIEDRINMELDDIPRREDGFIIGILEGGEQRGNFFKAF